MEVNEASARYERATGYVQTEVGRIPEDWRVASIDQISSVGRGRVISHKEISRSLSPKYPVYSSQTSNSGVMGYLDTFEFEGEYITWTTDGANAGTVFYRNGRFNCTNVCGTIKLNSDNHLFVAKMLGRFAPTYVSRHLGNPKLMNDVMKRVKIPLPPTKAEQEAIAEALSDADALIESLEQLLTKKRHLKQGAMQQLLTGKKRLPGFSGEWELKRLGNISPLQRGFDLPTTQIRLGNYPVVYSNGVLNYHDQFMVKGPGVVTGRSGTIGNVHYVEDNFWPHNTSLWVTSFKDNSPKFIFYLLTYIGLERFGTGSGVPTLNRNDVHAHKALIPPTAEEQTAIATILSDMDAELAALEEKLAKARAIKQGMMQELLTGRIRLV